jgi:hydrogenase maturation factor
MWGLTKDFVIHQRLVHALVVANAIDAAGTLDGIEKLPINLADPLLDGLYFAEPLGDGAIVTVGSERLAFTTDTFVVKPLFFPGGDIGSLAVHGTVNDLAVGGARPLVMTVALVLEEGLPLPILDRLRTGTPAMEPEADGVGCPQAVSRRIGWRAR